MYLLLTVICIIAYIKKTLWKWPKKAFCLFSYYTFTVGSLPLYDIAFKAIYDFGSKDKSMSYTIFSAIIILITTAVTILHTIFGNAIIAYPKRIDQFYYPTVIKLAVKIHFMLIAQVL
jgi:hypothetical protein